MRSVLNETKPKIRILTICGPSGAGKNTFRQAILKKYPQTVKWVATTSKRPNKIEIEGGIYNFISKEEFKAKIERGEFLEWEEVYTDTFYGTDRLKLEELMNDEKGSVVVFDIDYMGAFNLKKIYGDAVYTIFIIPPSIKELEERLRERGREEDTEEKIRERVGKATLEIEQASKFDKSILNDNLERALIELFGVLDGTL